MAKRKKSPADMTLEELHAEATAQGVEGRSSMNKEELLAALSGDDADGGDDDKGERPSNTTSGGERPRPAGKEGASIEGGARKGTAVYPPSPSDQAGEKTDNVPPTKRLPPDTPPGEAGADELTRLRAENAALAGVVRNLGGNPEEVAKTATAGLAQEMKAARGPMKRAKVTPVGGTPVDVEYPADAPDGNAAAVEAYKAKAGQWSLPSQPHVELNDE